MKIILTKDFIICFFLLSFQLKALFMAPVKAGVAAVEVASMGVTARSGMSSVASI